MVVTACLLIVGGQAQTCSWVSGLASLWLTCLTTLAVDLTQLNAASSHLGLSLEQSFCNCGAVHASMAQVLLACKPLDKILENTEVLSGNVGVKNNDQN